MVAYFISAAIGIVAALSIALTEQEIFNKVYSSGDTALRVTIASGSVIAAPGSDTQVLYNDGGSIGADSGLTFNETTNALTVAGQIFAADGTAAAPGLSFLNDPDTGLARDGASVTLRVVLSGIEMTAWDGSGHQVLRPASQLRWASVAPFTTPDLFLSRNAAADLQLGVDAAGGSVVAQTLRSADASSGSGAGGQFTVRAGSAFGTNQAGAELAVAAGPGTGSGISGIINFKSAPLGASSSAVNALVNVFTIDTPSATTTRLYPGTNYDNLADIGISSRRIRNFFSGTQLGVHDGSAFTNSFTANGAIIKALTAGLVTKVTGDSPYTVLATDYTVLCNTTSGNLTITLPTAVGIAGRILNIKKIAAANTCTLATSGTQTIDGTDDLTITVENESKTIQSNGANWVIL